MARGRARAVRLLLGLMTVAWLGSVLVTAAAVSLTRSAGTLNCEHPQSDSNYGDFSWSWFPLGTRCSWTEEANGFDEVSSPTWGPSVLVAAQLGAGLAIGTPISTSGGSTRSARRRVPAALGQAGPVTSHDDPDGAGVA